MKKYYNIVTFLALGLFSIISTFYYPYLRNSIGLSLSEVGTVVSLGSIFTLIGQPLISNNFSKSNNKKRFILIYLLSIIIGIFGLMNINKFTALIFAPFYGFILGSIAGIFDIYIEELALIDDYEFSSIRKWGSIGFAFIVFISGFIIGKLGYKALHVVALMIAFFMLLIIHLRFKNVSIHKSFEDKIKIFELVKDKNIILLVLMTILGLGSYMSLDFAFSTYIEDIVKNVELANKIYSFSTSFRVIIEFFAFIIVSKYLINANSKKYLSIALGFAALRIFLLSSGNIFLIILGDQTHGIMYAIYLTFLFKYLREILDSKYVATTFAILSVLGSNGSNFIYASLYSYIQNRFGYFYMYITGVILIITSIIILKTLLPNKNLKKS